jgi:tRNA (guanine-N7-)-methyltransferase
MLYVSHSLMSRTKSVRYNAAIDEPLLIQSGKEFFENCKGKRRSDYFGNTHPIVLELACGRGEYTVGLWQIYPEKNFIGVDVKGERMMMGIREYRAQVSNFTSTHSIVESWSRNSNIAFLRTIIHHIDRYFAPGEVDEIWIIHPDPRPKWHDERRRITSPRFLKMYHDILKLWGLLRLKTDDDGMSEYSKQQIENIEFEDEKWFELLNHTKDLSSSLLAVDHHGIETHYGKMFIAEGRTIKYGLRRKIR